jgi:hypothetical protein
MSEKYVPLRKKVEEAHGLATSYQKQIDELKEMVEELKKLVIASIKAERKVIRGKDGRPESVELVHEGEVLHRRSIRRDGGKIAGSE